MVMPECPLERGAGSTTTEDWQMDKHRDTAIEVPLEHLIEHRPYDIAAVVARTSVKAFREKSESQLFAECSTTYERCARFA